MHTIATLRCIKVFYEHDDCSLKAKTLEDLDTPLHIAARDGYLNIVKYLVCHGIDPEVV